jgi:putative hemolysin
MSIEILNREAQGEMVQSSKATVEPVASDVLGRIGNLETRLARTAREIDAAQAVRYRVFVEEMNAQLPADAMRRQRDVDSWDAICDHLLVLDRSIEGDPEDQIVGTYRLLRQEVAMANGGFYSSSEFDIDALLARHPDKRFMELGRSCVLPAYRNKRTVELLWQGNWAYALKHGMGAMIGCASFPGVLPEQHALALSFLYHTVGRRCSAVARPDHGPDAGRSRQSEESADGDAAADQGISAPRCHGRFQRRCRPRLQHDRCADRTADRQHLGPLRQLLRRGCGSLRKLKNLKIGLRGSQKYRSHR